MKPTIFGCAALFVLSFGARPLAYAQTPASTDKRVVVKEAHMSFVLPPDYQLKMGRDMAGLDKHVLFVCQGPKTDGFAANANVVIQPAPVGAKADVPSALQLGSGMKRALPTYKEGESGLLMIGGEKASFHSCTFSVQNHAIALKQVLVFHNGQMVIISFGAIASAYPKQVGAFDKMLASVKWL